ncbi:MAG: FAD-dependent oxidoreductase, partial [Nitrososphaera sp.]|nr:FAD-dependent oxidoreductase [Nitrososphaera sp.]
HAIKILLRFTDRWWIHALGKDFSEMDFIHSNEVVRTYWTQYPATHAVLTGWLAGPRAEKFKDTSDADILDVALVSLSRIFGVALDVLHERLVASKIANWPADPYAQGAYSYDSLGSKEARQEIRKPIHDVMFFAGEAVYEGKETATVEGALASGLETAHKILDL